MMRAISKLCLLLTEYTMMYPWIPIKCFELRMLYSSLFGGLMSVGGSPYARLHNQGHKAKGLVSASDGLEVGCESWGRRGGHEAGEVGGAGNMYLSRSIDNLRCKVLTLVSNNFAEGIFNGGIV
jgi:hypothetical protein